MFDARFMVSRMHIQDLFSLKLPLPVGMKIKNLLDRGTDFNKTSTDNFQEIVEIWNTVEESFQQVGYSLNLKVVGEGKRCVIVSESCFDKQSLFCK